MSRKHKQNRETAELQTNSPARWIKKKKGEMESRDDLPPRHDFPSALPATTKREGKRM